MTRELKGESEVAMLAEGLPVRSRVCLTLLAADFALQRLRGSPEFNLARDTLTMALNWQKGERADLDKWDNLFKDTLGFASLRASKRSTAEGLAWCVLEYPICHTAFHVFRTENLPVPLSIPTVESLILDDLDKDLRALEPSSMALMSRAAAYLTKHPNASLAQLKVHVSER
ncbi:MAG TPA: hypothetical protein VGG01_24745 [Xanthobacteraceae bacterium]|jgi:hypothetical protein